MAPAWLLVGCGGFAGAVLRWGAGTAIARAGGAFPWATLAVNAIGCLAIGFVMSATETRGGISSEMRALVVTGVLGGFTTFSAFGWETFALLRAGSTGLAAANIAAQLALGIAAVACGFAWGRAG